MLFSRKFTVETSESQGKVLEKLRQVIETKEYSKPKSRYRGEFAKEGFLIVPKISAASVPHVLILGEFIKTATGTNISIKIQLFRIIKVIFWLINAMLVFMLWKELSKPAGKWLMVIGFLVFLWLFFQAQLWIEVKSIKNTIKSLFENDRKENAATTS